MSTFSFFHDIFSIEPGVPQTLKRRKYGKLKVTQECSDVLLWYLLLFCEPLSG